MPLPIWFKLHSERIAPYNIDDISVIIPSAAGRYEKRWEWFWPQYVKNTHPDIVNRTYIPCDPEEVDKLADVCWGEDGIQPIIFPVEPRWIVHKTIGALDSINTRLTFRLANDIMVVRPSWHKVLLKQFNASEKQQVISEIQHGISSEETWSRLCEQKPYFKKAYPKPPVSAVYPHGSRLFAQTAVWQAFYRPTLSITAHDHDDIVFGQLAQSDGVQFSHFGGINAYLPHKGITSRDFSEDYVEEIEESRRVHESAPDNAGFRTIG